MVESGPWCEAMVASDIGCHWATMLNGERVLLVPPAGWLWQGLSWGLGPIGEVLEHGDPENP